MKDIFKYKYFTKFLPLYIVVLTLVLLFGSSYALLRSTRVGANTYTMNVGTLSVSFVDQDTNNIAITNMYPMTDEEGFAQDGTNDILEFTITNDGNLKANYNVYIEELDSSIPMSNVMKYSFSRNNSEYVEPILLGTDNYLVRNGYLNVGESATFKVKMWLDESANKNYMNQTFKARVIVEALQYQMNKNEIIRSVSNNQLINDSTNIKFYQVNGTNNGNGLFVYPGTENDEYPIYYYRGNITNNNMIFGGFCWKIVRTTETGGTKLIYNGVPDNSGHCTAEGDATEIGKSAFNTNYNSLAYVGYNYGTVYPYGTQKYYETKNISTYENDTFYIGDGITQDGNIYNLNNPVSIAKSNWQSVYSNYAMNGNTKYYVCLDGASSCENPTYIITTSATNYYYYTLESSHPDYLYGQGYTYENGVYTLTNTKTVSEWTVGYNTLNNNHYTCLNSTGTCENIKFIWYTANYYARYITLSNNKPLSEALSEMLTTSSDNNKSIVQGVINTWYEQNLKTNYAAYLEDTAWCNDRTVSTSNLGGWMEDGNTTTYMYFDVRKRMHSKNENTPPKLTCENMNDNLSVASGKLDYPIALLTADEVAIAGGVWGSSNNNYYLRTGSWYWLLSPSSVGFSDASGVRVYTTGYMDGTGVYVTSGGVRPAISLKHGIEIASGTGEPDNPYTVKPLT